MQPITFDTFAANAYRTLGLSGAAGQSAIEAAARRMRIWPDAAHIPPTPWDLPSLGALRRSKSEIEQAAALLLQPASRLEQRLLWFCTDQPRPGAIGDTSPAGQHARLLTNLQALLAKRELDSVAKPWSSVLSQLHQACASTEYFAWQQELERTGSFEKSATDAEIQQVLEAFPAALAAGLVPRAIEAFEDTRIESVKRISVALASFPPAAEAIRTLFDRLEDDFVNHTAEMERELRDTLRTNHQNPHPWYGVNLQHARFGSDYYSKHIAPTMSVLLNETVASDDRADRVKERAAEVLVLLALGWEWGGAPGEAERLLQNALKLARGTLVESKVQAALDRVTPMAEASRRSPHKKMPAPSIPWREKLRQPGRAVVIIIFGAIVILAAVVDKDVKKSAPWQPPTLQLPVAPTFPDPSKVRDPDAPPPINESTGEVNHEP